MINRLTVPHTYEEHCIKFLQQNHKSHAYDYSIIIKGEFTVFTFYTSDTYQLCNHYWKAFLIDPQS